MSNLPASTEWIKAAKAGEDVAWRKLYRRYYPGAYALALRICGNTPVAQDAVQDAFMVAYLKLAQLTDPAAFGGWIRKIVMHTCYRALQQNRSTTRLDMVSSEMENYWDDEITRKFDQLATQSRLHAALAQLPDVLRSTLLLRYFSSFQAYEEIAAILCVPVGTVRSRLSQAKLKLMEHWQKHSDAGESSFTEADEWNAFYHALYGGMHEHDGYKDKLLNHFHPHIRIVLSSGNWYTGGGLLDTMVREDRQVGSWLKPVTVLSSGSISIIEATHFNSPEYPNHCPATSVAVLYRDQGKVSLMQLHPSAK